ncbi:MAG: bifunctional DNA-formamidopyrimidine glycosylase/DNA-(apurinic or apyrimidinic site) lyase [Burkholderiaceae bacterium]
MVRESRLRWPIPDGLAAQLEGRILQAADRRGKYLLLRFGPGVLIVHLGMSGNFRFQADPGPPARHDHVDLVFGHGLLRYHDPRRFGAMLWHPDTAGVHPLLAGLGVEPLGSDFTAAQLHHGTRGRRVSIKQLLLSGKVVVGVGNIYASESLHRAGIRPGTIAARLGLARCARLVEAIRETLADALAQGGTTLRDFGGADGAGGYFQLSCRVYGREGEPCVTCATPIRREVTQGRATYWCRHCQK